MKYIVVLLLTAFFVNMTKGSQSCSSCTLDPSSVQQDKSRGCAALGSYLQCLRNCGADLPKVMEQQYKETCGTVGLSVSLLTVLSALLVTAYTKLHL